MDKKRQAGPVVFSTEMLNQPVDRETAIFKNGVLPSATGMEKLRESTRVTFLTIDTKATDVKNAATDRHGVTLNFVDYQNNWHLMICRMEWSVP